ncbi:EamA family transporter [Tepidimonas charontis]|uniref:EamA-like transporter family protein n=1 Tax=Tepidimonas charontis TaxID=2267262 RepID=A0A554X742_9BURK|nr:EamA family transporter [Tepidimonas charontis]TSE31648.1 EamA-like transporter family protein [Tepidimonas charontis]
MLSRTQALALAALTLMWGVNWPVMKLSLQELSPLFFRAVTMTGGALWLYAFYRWRGVRLRPRRSEWRSIVTLAIPNMLGWHTLAILVVCVKLCKLVIR